MFLILCLVVNVYCDLCLSHVFSCCLKCSNKKRIKAQIVDFLCKDKEFFLTFKSLIVLICGYSLGILVTLTLGLCLGNC